MASKILPIPTVPQYETPFCFYACTSMVLAYFGIYKTVSEITYEMALDHPGDYLDAYLGEYSGAIGDYLRDNGLESNLYIDKGWDDIKKHIDDGRPLIAGVKASATDNRPNHAWVIRGYDDTNGKKIIYNNPWENPGSQDPIAYDPDADGTPGETMGYQSFVDNHWSSPIATTHRTFIAVSYKGQGAGKDYFDWRGAGGRNGGRWYYHMSRMTRKFHGWEFGEVIAESLIAAVAFVGFVLGFIQLVGQIFEAAGHALMDAGKKYWDKGGVGGKILGGALIGLGAIVAGLGYAIDFVAGVLGVVVDVVTSVFDAIGSILTGSAGGSVSRESIDLGLNLQVRPWESRWGDNWEKISGSWSVSLADGSSVDGIKVWWKIVIWGWGIDDWSLSHRTVEVAGTVEHDELVFDGNHHKNFYVELTNAQGIRQAFGEDKCQYGKDGAMTRVKLEVETRVTRNGQQTTLSTSESVWGFSA